MPETIVIYKRSPTTLKLTNKVISSVVINAEGRQGPAGRNGIDGKDGVSLDDVDFPDFTLMFENKLI